MTVQSGPEFRVNSYALVSYLAGPLGGFLNELRRELDPDSDGMSHLTILPPRTLPRGSGEVWDTLKVRLRSFEPFDVELGNVEVFPQTRVIYLSVGTGFRELVHMHEKLNCGSASFVEPFEYHPHVTLAQDLDGQSFDKALALCGERWDQFKHSRCHAIDRLTFVQNTLDECWTDLAALDLASHVVR